MAGIKISALPAVGAALLTDFFPVVQGGVTSKETLQQVVALFNSNIQLSSVAQVTGLPAALASFLPLAGGTMTGNIDMGMHRIINLDDPINPQDATTKNYVDTFASGLTVILAAQAATTANLNATQAGAGVGATLTNAGAMVAFSVDGYAAALNDRILVKNQTLPEHNGVYTVTTVGSGAVNWVLTRATDYDQAPSEIKPGTLIAVNNGTVNATTSWLETATVVTVDTDPILFSQFTFSPTAFFQIVNNLSEGVPATMRTNLGLTSIATATPPLSGTLGGTGVNNGANTITLGGNISTAGALTLAGAFAATFTFTSVTGVTFPTSGTLLTSAQPTINQPNIVGTTTNDNAAAGSVGEFVSSVIAAGAAVACTNNVDRNVTSISLTAGDWDVWGNVSMIASGAFGIGWAWGSTTSATQPDASLYAGLLFNAGSAAGVAGITVPPFRASLAGTTTVYLSVRARFSAGTVSACGGIYARRRR